MENVSALLIERTALIGRATKILDVADAEKRSLTEAERRQFDVRGASVPTSHQRH
jgi:hypothetical protein